MNNSPALTPDTIRLEAKSKALTILNTEPDCISYVRPEDLETAALFIPVVSIIKPTRDDFYDPIPEVGIMAKPQLVNLLKEKAGINITRTETSKRGEFCWVAHCWGEKRQPDGTMITEDASYEFDVELRCELDFLNQPQKYDSEIAKRKHILKTARFGEQRAVTGAQHSLIHKLAHVARSFKSPEVLMRGMKVLRIDRNVNGILSDPQMRDAALRQAMGATDQLFGPKKTEAIAAPEIEPTMRDANPPTAEEEDPFGEKPEATFKTDAEIRAEKAITALREYQSSDRLNQAQKDGIQKVFDRGESDVIILESFVARVKAAYDKAGAPA